MTDQASIGTEERIILNVDLDAVVPCNYSAACPNAAEWVYRCPSCRHAWIHCTPHRESEDRAEVAIPEDLMLVCATCETELPIPAPWRHL